MTMSGKKITDRSNYWSDSHRKMLYHMAAVCAKMFRYRARNIELDELVSEGWIRCARYSQEMSGCGTFILQAMARFVRLKLMGLSGNSHMTGYYLEEIKGFETMFRTKIDHTKEVDSRDNIAHIIALIPKESTRYIFKRFFIDGIHKAEIAREVGIGKCSLGSRISIALRHLKEDLKECV